MSYCFYESRTLQGTRPLVVYTPPGYHSGTGKYPVFYLVSGATDTEETWFRAGRVNFILDNLIAQQKAVPMIVVMPYGNMMMAAPMPSSPEVAAMYQVCNDELTGDIIPYIESTYRVLPDRGETGHCRILARRGPVVVHRLQQFGQVRMDRLLRGLPDAGSLRETFSRPDRRCCRDQCPAQAALAGRVGWEDFLYKPATGFGAFLKEKGIAHSWLETDGGHTWMNARHYLAETLQLFFK